MTKKLGKWIPLEDAVAYVRDESEHCAIERAAGNHEEGTARALNSIQLLCGHHEKHQCFLPSNEAGALDRSRLYELFPTELARRKRDAEEEEARDSRNAEIDARATAAAALAAQDCTSDLIDLSAIQFLAWCGTHSRELVAALAEPKPCPPDMRKGIVDLITAPLEYKILDFDLRVAERATRRALRSGAWIGRGESSKDGTRDDIPAEDGGAAVFDFGYEDDSVPLVRVGKVEYSDLTFRPAQIAPAVQTPPAASLAEDHASGPIDSEGDSKKVRGRPKGAGAFDDSKIIDEMKSGFDAGDYKSPWQAATALAKRAGGNSTIESKADRLARKYAKKFGEK